MDLRLPKRIPKKLRPLVRAAVERQERGIEEPIEVWAKRLADEAVRIDSGLTS